MIFADLPYFLSNGGITCHAGKMVSVNKGKWDKSNGFAMQKFGQICHADIYTFNRNRFISSKERKKQTLL